jgi:hypothetical protein
MMFLGIRLHGVRVHFRHHQRHVRIHPEVAGIVDDDRPAAPIFSPHSLEIAAGAHQHDIDGGEVELRQILAVEDLVAERDFHADGFAAGDGVHLVHGEFDFLEDVEHLAAHIARGADHGDPVTHRALPIEWGGCGSAFTKSTNARSGAGMCRRLG